MTLGAEADVATITAFVASRGRRDRLLKILNSKKRRRELDRALSHEDLWDAATVRPLGHEKQTPEGVETVLRELGAPEICRVLGGPLDQQELRLADALATIVGSLSGCIIICVPARLAYHEGEEPNARSVLVRASESGAKRRVTEGHPPPSSS